MSLHTSVNYAKATGKLLKGSVQKINLVADLVRGLRAQDAIMQLRFCRKVAASSILKVLHSAIANAENNHGMDIDKLKITTVDVGKGMTLKRMRTRARGKASIIKKRFSQITMIVQEG